MSTKNVTLHDENGNILLPATKTSRVTDANGTNLDTLLQQAGQVKSISVNGVTQTIDANGNVNIASADGVGIASVVQTTTSTEDGGTNVITVTKTDNTTSTFSVKNGSKGSKGDQGIQGERGLPGESGVTGDVSGFTVIQTIDPDATYGATDIAGAATVQATNAELTELEGMQFRQLNGLTIASSDSTSITTSTSDTARIYYSTVNTGDIITISASNSEAKRFIAAFTTSVPAEGVSVTNVIGDATHATIDYNMTALSDGYIVISKTSSYFADMAATKRYSKLDKYESDISELYDATHIDWIEIDISQYTEVSAYISTNNQWLSSGKGVFIPTQGGREYEFTATTNGFIYSFLTSKSHTVNQTPSYATGGSRVYVAEGETETSISPDDATYLYVSTENTNGVRAEYVVEQNPGSIAQIVSSMMDYDDVPTEGSEKIVKSGGVYDAMKFSNSYTVSFSGEKLSQVIQKNNSENSFMTWITALGSIKSVIAPIEGYVGKVLSIRKNPNGVCNVVFLSDNTHVNGSTPSFSRYEKFVSITNDGEVLRFLLTDNDKYIYYQSVNSGGVNITPIFSIEEIAHSNYVFDTVENYNLTLDRTDYNLLDYDAESNPDGINPLDLTILSSDQTWAINGSSRGFFLDISEHKGGYLFVSSVSDNCFLAFLRDTNYSNASMPNYAAGSGRTTVGSGMRMKFAIPNDANYVFFGYKNVTGIWQCPTGVFAIGKDIGGSTEVGRTLDIGHVILQKKANQYLNLKWTAKANISGSYVTAGEHTGMLYSSVQEYDRSIGNDVSLKTFMTAVNNPYSLLYTENCHTGSTDSDYNMSYHAIGGGTTHGFFGTVCSRFACLANGMDEWSTNFYAWLSAQGYLTKIKDQSAQGVAVGDMVWIPGHVQIVTNYVKSNGVVTNVTITEAWQPLVRLVKKTSSEFDSYLSSNNGYIYRNNEIYKNVIYEPSEFVAIDDEISQVYQYNNDICTYAGDYAAFRMKEDNDSRNDYKVWLNYNLGDTPSRTWTAIKLYRESRNDNNALSLVLVATYNDVDFTQHKYLIPSTDLSVAGKYRACLTDGTVDSEPTYFEIIETDVSYTRNSENVTVNYDSINGTPIKIVVGTLGGSHRAVRILSPEERMNGVVTFNPYKLAMAQQPNTYDVDNVYIKVFFKGEYGRVTNCPLKIDYNS